MYFFSVKTSTCATKSTSFGNKDNFVKEYLWCCHIFWTSCPSNTIITIRTVGLKIFYHNTANHITRRDKSPIIVHLSLALPWYCTNNAVELFAGDDSGWILRFSLGPRTVPGVKNLAKIGPGPGFTFQFRQ